MTEPSNRTVRISNRGLAFSRRGAGPTLLFVHGWCLSRRIWLYQDVALASSFTVVCPDLAGFGDSAALAGPYELSRHARDLADLLDELSAEQVIVVGFAYGAMVAMELATAFPDALDGLVLIGTPSAATAPYDRMPSAMRRDWPKFAARSARGICAEDTSEATFAWLGRIFVGTPLPVALAALEELSRWEPLPGAEGIGTRTLLVHGNADQIVPPDVSDTVAHRMANASVERVDGAAHLVPIDRKEHINQLIADFARATS